MFIAKQVSILGPFYHFLTLVLWEQNFLCQVQCVLVWCSLIPVNLEQWRAGVGTFHGRIIFLKQKSLL